METTNIVEQLLRGSQNIDRMQSEVHQLVKMVIGFARRSNNRVASCVEIYETFENKTCKWEVRGVMGSLDKSKNKIHVQCTVKLPCGAPYQDHFTQSVGYCSETWVPFHSEYTQQVYQNLHAFVEGMLQVIPSIKNEMKTFLDASEMF